MAQAQLYMENIKLKFKLKNVFLGTGLIILDWKKENRHLNTSYVKPVVKNGPSLKSDRIRTDLGGNNEPLQYCLEAAVKISARCGMSALSDTVLSLKTLQ